MCAPLIIGKMKKKQMVMVCVTRQRNCERLIKSGATIAEAKGQELLVVHAIRSQDQIMGCSDESEALNYLYQKTTDYDGQMSMIRTENVLMALARCARLNNVGLIIMGASPDTSTNSITAKLKNELPGVNIMVVGSEDDFENHKIELIENNEVINL